MLNLPNVTLVAFGSTNIEGMQHALAYSQLGVKYGAVKLITDVPCRSIEEWNKNVVFKLGRYIDTEFALLVHPDGFVVEPLAWKDEFLNYDYIGAPWPVPKDMVSYRDKEGNLIRVGNSVSLRSKRLLDAPTDLDMEWRPFHGYTNEDGYICVNMRHKFIEAGCTFAPLELAVHFGREHDIDENKDVRRTFTFHKRYSKKNLKYPLFDDEEL